ncbi:MAG TPA: nucleotidyltransferase domain-containing protein [Thermomicrobiales bacterium]|nr:nucleotidyltransferase domain-containing protein [Thermomicrobiales bacterium]
MQTFARIDIPIEALEELCRRYHVRELALFGSVLRDDFRDDSDIDILVEYEPDAGVGLYEHFDLGRALEDLLGRSVDLVPKNGLRPLLRDSVLTTSAVIYAA